MVSIMSNQHVMKIHPAPLADLLSGAKTAEVRRNDRGFQVGDTVRLMEVNPETGNWTGGADHVRIISHIQTGYGLPEGMCVLSYAKADHQDAGHGHVTPRADGVVMKCGGPRLCAVCTAEKEAQGARASEFEREDRYIVIKRKDLVALHRDAYGPTQVAIEAFYAAIRMIEVQLPRRDYLVIEGDWPEYEPTWAAIQARVEGRAAAGTTSDQYRAELYDEVWQKARDMGYCNVTEALVALDRMKAATGEPVHQWADGILWQDSDESDLASARAEGFKTRTLWTAPPTAAHGVAQLQSLEPKVPKAR